jgi:hypothetical protein
MQRRFDEYEKSYAAKFQVPFFYPVSTSALPASQLLCL